jgi:chemosensory pili system protein ChpA (sensor histidine kinase/response regulator)
MAFVLLVDDDYDSSAALAAFLRKGGHAVQHVADGRQALVSVMEMLPDVVVLDLKMPHMNGVGFLEVVRSYLRLRKLPIVLWTGHEDALEIDEAMKLGVEAVLIKARTDYRDILAEVDRIIAKPASEAGRMS